MTTAIAAAVERQCHFNPFSGLSIMIPYPSSVSLLRLLHQHFIRSQEEQSERVTLRNNYEHNNQGMFLSSSKYRRHCEISAGNFFWNILLPEE